MQIDAALSAKQFFFNCNQTIAFFTQIYFNAFKKSDGVNYSEVQDCVSISNILGCSIQILLAASVTSIQKSLKKAEFTINVMIQKSTESEIKLFANDGRDAKQHKPKTVI